MTPYTTFAIAQGSRQNSPARITPAYGISVRLMRPVLFFLDAPR